MHDSMKRLLDYAKQLPQSRAGQIHSFADIGRRMEVSAGVLTNWKARGISKEGALRAEEVFGCSANWLLNGEGSRDAAAAPPPVVGRPAATGKVDFRSRHVNESEWDMLESIRLIPEDEREHLVAMIHKRAGAAKRAGEAVVASVSTVAKAIKGVASTRGKDKIKGG